jgi:hypothetical protein
MEAKKLARLLKRVLRERYETKRNQVPKTKKENFGTEPMIIQASAYEIDKLREWFGDK